MTPGRPLFEPPWEALEQVRSDHLLRPRAGPEGSLLVDQPEGGTLAELLARRGPLSAGEVVTALAPVAAVLAEAHAAGLVHGRLCLRDVLLTTSGKPLLDGTGLLGVSVADASVDVVSLGRLVGSLLAPADRHLLQELIDDAVVARLTMADLADRLLNACEAEPLAGVGVPDPPVLVPLLSGPSGRPDGPQRGRRRWLVMPLAVIAVAGVAATAWSSRVPSAVPAPRPVVWAAVLEGLDESRAAAFAAADPALLAKVYPAGSPLLTADRRALSSLAGARAVGLRHEVRSVRPVYVGEERVELEVVEALRPYVIEQSGALVRRVTQSRFVTRQVVLRQTAQGWRVESALSRP